VSKNYEDPIATLVEYTASMTTDAISIPWNATIFCIENKLSLYIHKTDLMEIISGTKDLNVSIVQLWMM